VQNANFENRGELLLEHLFEGIDLQPDYMSQTLQNVYKIWGRPVCLVTVMENEPQLFRYDGQEFTNKNLGTPKDKAAGEKG
jgi:stage V sporulation protein R